MTIGENIRRLRKERKLTLMTSWMTRYNEYLNEVDKCNEIKDVKQRGEALINAENRFNWWMDTYPEGESNLDLLRIQATHDEFMNKLGENPKNEE